MVKARDWKWSDFRINPKTKTKTQKGFQKFDRKVCCVFSFWEIEKIVYICVGDEAQKWDKTPLLFESWAKIMFWVKWENDSGQELKTQNLDFMIQVSDLIQVKLWFEIQNQNQNP